MAAYCGERFIVEQLQSILAQLASADELIVVDDHSTDRTVELISRFSDPRIRLVQQHENLGIIRTFERALELATGDILFLADQDDIWPSNKVERYLEAFHQSPEALLVVSDLTIIDDFGNRQPSGRALRWAFRPGVVSNLVKNRYQGCRMAFRSEVLNWTLPFPPNIPMHDSWIGISTQLHGRVLYLPEKLLLHRQHDRNHSGELGRSFLAMLRDRLNLIRALLGLMLKSGASRTSGARG